MADSTETRALLLQINATTEVLRSQLTLAEQATAKFQSDTQRHLDSVDSRFEAFGKNLEKPLEQLKRLGEFTIGALIGESLIETGKKALEFAGNVQFVSEQVGVSTDFLQKFRFAAGQFGASTAEADAGLSKFSRSIGQAANGNQAMIALFDRLGVKIRDAAGNVRSTETIYSEVATAISKLGSSSQQSTDTLQLFGRASTTLVPLLKQGGDGFNGLAQAAEQLGVVLGPDLIAHSEEVNHKLAALKQIVDAQMASAVAQNAGNIEAIASALVKLSGAVAKFLSSDPERAVAILGALAGGKIGGLPGALIGGAAGAIAGHMLNQQQLDESKDPDVRLQQLLASRNRLQSQLRVRSGSGGSLVSDDDLTSQIAEVHRQLNLYQHRSASTPEAEALGSTGAGATNVNTSDALATANQQLADLEKQKAGASGAALTAYNEEIAAKKREIGFIKQGADAQLASSLASKQGSAEKSGEAAAVRAARKAEEERVKQLEQDRAFEGQLRQANEALARVKVQLADTAQGQLDVELLNLRDAETTREQQLQDQVAAGKITAARADQLRKIYQETESSEEILANRKAQGRLVQEAATREALELQGKIALLSTEDQLALTSKERLKVELKLLDLQEQLAKKAQQEIIDNPLSTAEQKKNAATTIGQIDTQHAGNVAVVTQRNEGPLAQYRDQLRSSVGDMNEALQGVEVDGLKGLADGLTGVITGTKSVGAAFKEMAASIVQDLIKIQVEKAILGSIGGGSSGGGGLFGSLLGGLGKVFGGGGDVQNEIGALSIFGFADGGHIKGPGGPRSDSILAAVSNGEFIVNADATKKNLALLNAINDNKVPRFADGGLVGLSLRTPSMPDVRGMGRGSGIELHQHFDLSNSMITEKVYADMHGIASAHAARALAAAPSLTMQQIAKRNRRSLAR